MKIWWNVEQRKYGWLPQKFPWKEILKEVILHFTDIDQDMIKVYKNTSPGLIWWYQIRKVECVLLENPRKVFTLSNLDVRMWEMENNWSVMHNTKAVKCVLDNTFFMYHLRLNNLFCVWVSDSDIQFIHHHFNVS